jgi:hypothetical protein
MPKKGERISEETRDKIRRARALQWHPRFVAAGITPDMVADAHAQGLRWCSGDCKAFVPADQFSEKSHKCRPCVAASIQRWRERLTADQRASAAEYHRARRAGRPIKWPITTKRVRSRVNDESERRRHYRRKYGITPEWYERTLAAQGGVCAICGSDRKTQGQSYFPVDHCHESGKVRGILCVECNHAIGRLDKFPDWAERATAYLAQFSIPGGRVDA